MGSITVITTIFFIFALSTRGVKASQPARCPFEVNPCFLRPNPGPCRGAFERYFWNQKTKSCEPFNWGGCRGIVPFNTKDECMIAKCRFVRCGNPESGPIRCNAAIPLWKYDARAGVCVPFIYGGCGPFLPFNTEGECIAEGCALQQ